MNDSLLTNLLAVGQQFEGAMTVTETHIVLGSGLIGGFQPVHIDLQYAQSRGLQATILHGSLTAAIMSAVVGRHLPAGGWTVMEQATRYRAMVYAGDTLMTVWTVAKHSEQLKLRGWVVELEGICKNQSEALVAESRKNLLVRLPASVPKPG